MPSKQTFLESAGTWNGFLKLWTHNAGVEGSSPPFHQNDQPPYG
jgi:hypothetical protein